VEEGENEAVDVLEEVEVDVAVAVAVAVGDGVREAVGLRLGVREGVGVGVPVPLRVPVGVRVAEEEDVPVVETEGDLLLLGVIDGEALGLREREDEEVLLGDMDGDVELVDDMEGEVLLVEEGDEDGVREGLGLGKGSTVKERSTVAVFPAGSRVVARAIVFTVPSCVKLKSTRHWPSVVESSTRVANTEPA